MRKIKALALLSGGLDSTLAIKVILEQGIEVEAINFISPFCLCTPKGNCKHEARRVADKLGIKLKVINVTQEYIEMVKDPRYGYGKNLNPCLDCRIFMQKKAKEYMKKINASFVITGEVLGQRPMSQRRDALAIIERDSGLKGLVLRPLSAKLLKPTIPEERGRVDREKLLEISGRSRKIQMDLAKEYKIGDYLCPAGGCLLTDPGFAKRMGDLIEYKPDFTIKDIQLLKVGRHFRLTPEAKLIVGRNEKENKGLKSLAKEGDICFYPTKVKGPVGIGRGIFTKDILPIASSIVARYSDNDGNQKLEILYKWIPDSITSSIVALPAKEVELKDLRI